MTRKLRVIVRRVRHEYEIGNILLFKGCASDFWGPRNHEYNTTLAGWLVFKAEESMLLNGWRTDENDFSGIFEVVFPVGLEPYPVRGLYE